MEVRDVTLKLLDRGLSELDKLRDKYGAHRDFDLVETHQRRLIDTLRTDMHRHEGTPAEGPA